MYSYTCGKHSCGASDLNFFLFGFPDQGGDARETMQIFVKTLTGETIVVHVDAFDTVDIFFIKIQVKMTSSITRNTGMELTDRESKLACREEVDRDEKEDDAC